MYCCLHNGWCRSGLCISGQSWLKRVRVHQCLFPNFALVIWQLLCWGHVTICWAMCIASVVTSSWVSTTSTRLNKWTFIDTQIFSTIWTLVRNIFCTVSTKWNATTSARDKCHTIIKKSLNRWCFPIEESEKNTLTLCLYSHLFHATSSKNYFIS